MLSYIERGNIWNNIGESAKVIADFKLVIDLNNSGTGVDASIISGVYLGLGEVCQSLDKEKALDYFDRAINLGNAKANYQKKSF